MLVTQAKTAFDRPTAVQPPPNGVMLCSFYIAELKEEPTKGTSIGHDSTKYALPLQAKAKVSLAAQGL